MSRKKTRLYFGVTKDKYELPIGVCTASEIPRVLHTNKGNVSDSVSKYKRGVYKWTRYRAVDIEEGEDGEEE